MNQLFERIDPKQFFADREHNAQWWRKTANVTARPATPGEQVLTILNDKLETKNIAGVGDMLVRNPAGEQYLVPPEKFAARYALTDNCSENQEGFREYKFVGEAVPCVHLNRNVEFLTSRGELMRIERGGYLINNGHDSFYGIQRSAIMATYTRSYPDGRLLCTETWERAYSQACSDACDAHHLFNIKNTDATVEASALRHIDPGLVGMIGSTSA